MSNTNTILFFVLVLLLPAVVFAGSGCNSESDGATNKRLALTYKLWAIAAILVAGGLGACLPVLGWAVLRLSPKRSFFSVIKAFAATVILATGFIHVLSDAFESLTSPCLPAKPWGDFSFTGFIAMVSAIRTLMADTYATAYYSKLSAGANTEQLDEQGANSRAKNDHGAETELIADG